MNIYMNIMILFPAGKLTDIDVTFDTFFCYVPQKFINIRLQIFPHSIYNLDMNDIWFSTFFNSSQDLMRFNTV